MEGNSISGWGGTSEITLVHDQRTEGTATDQRSFLEQRIDITSFERILAVCFDGSGERMLAQWESLIGDGLDDIGIIDVGRDVRSTEAVDGAPPPALTVERHPGHWRHR